MEEYAIDGSFKVDPLTKEFDINFDLPSSGLKIKGLSKSFLISKTSEIPNENGIYILEGEEQCYVGQSKDLKKRLKSHQDNNKISFTRCFILSHIIDIRQYLDFMEAYAIKEMNQQGYILDNKTNPNPDDDKLPSAKKSAAKKWVDEFLLFLPVLGFKKTKEELTNNSKDTNVQKINKVKCSISLVRDNYKIDSIGFFSIESNQINVVKGSVGFFAKDKYQNIVKSQKELLDKKIIEIKKENKNCFIFIQDYVFESPSSAARFILGISANGWVNWMTEDNKILDNLRETIKV